MEGMFTNCRHTSAATHLRSSTFPVALLPRANMPALNRTPEFFAAVETARHRGAGTADSQSKQRLLRDKTSVGQKRSDFTKAALQIAKELQAAMVKLDKLAQRESFPQLAEPWR